jgi:flagella synthesis protein FlgN
MNDIYSVLIKIDLLLNELTDILVDEEKELSRFKVNAITLQSLADKRHRVITAIHFYDRQRCQLEREKTFSPPYSHSSELADSWKTITKKIRQTAELHERIHFLIERQMQNIKLFQTVIHELQEQHFIYESGGDKEITSPAPFYHISV